MAQKDQNPHFSHFRKPLIIMMSGFTATGKSHTAQRIADFLNKGSIKAEIIASDILRRSHDPVVDASYFDECNKECSARRAAIYYEMLSAAEKLLPEVQAIILDAGYNKRSMRELVYGFAKRKSVCLVIVNTVCDDEQEIRSRISRRNPENPKEVANDFGIYLLSKTQADPIKEDMPLIIFDTKLNAFAHVSKDSAAQFLAGSLTAKYENPT